MILILSTEGFEESTDQVLNWLDYLCHPYMRVNGEDLGAMSFELDPSGDESWLEIADHRIWLKDIDAIWYRRTGQRHLAELFPIDSMPLRLHMAHHLLAEMHSLKGSLYAGLSQKPWLSHPNSSAPNKFEMLQTARRLGITIPPTKILSRSAQLKALIQQWGPVIIKCLSDTRMYREGADSFNQYTVAPDPILEALPQAIFPTLVQAQIEKAFEIRTFFFEGQCYSMAIFSQQNSQTSTDFRIYDYAKPSRCIPYQLPASLTKKVILLMEDFGLTNGSLDFIYGKDGEHYFLEINPVGQFGMVSYPCNYRLEKKIAQFLTEVHPA